MLIKMVPNSLGSKLSDQKKRCSDSLEKIKGLRDNLANAVDEACDLLEHLIGRAVEGANSQDTSLRDLSDEIDMAFGIAEMFQDVLKEILEIEEVQRPPSIVIPAFQDSASPTDCSTSGTSGEFHMDSSFSPIQVAEGACASTSPFSETSGSWFRGADYFYSPPGLAWTTTEAARMLMEAAAANSAASGQSAMATSETRDFDNQQFYHVLYYLYPDPGGVYQEESHAVSPSAQDYECDNISSPTEESFPTGDTVRSGQFSYAQDKSVRFRFCDIESPDEFYVDPLPNETGITHDTLHSDLSQFYDDANNRKPLFRDGGPAERKLGVYGIYYYRASAENTEIERCEIVGWRETATMKRFRGIQRYEAQIRLIDLGSKRWVSAMYLWKLHQRFCDIPAFTVRCQLFDIQPKIQHAVMQCDAGTVSWTEAAIERFKSICDGDRPFLGLVANKREPFRLIVYDIRESKKACVNAILVRENHARSLTNWNRAHEIAVVLPNVSFNEGRASGWNVAPRAPDVQ